ncbi:MAG TPA: hypothetical protein VF491_17505 [Vicinamibacterales bacterium]
MRRVNAVVSKLPTSPSEILALDLDLVKLQRRVGSSTALDALFRTWILAAAAHFEEQTGRPVMRADFEYRLDCFPPCDRFIEIPRAPLVSVSSITYAVDGSPDTATVDTDTYSVQAPVGLHCAPGRIVLASGASWPTPSQQQGAVVIAFTAGYAETSADVPALIQSALFFLVGHFHKYGEEVIGGPDASSLQKIPLGAEKLFEAFKFSALPTQALWEVPWLA